MIANLKPEANYQLAITNFQFEMPHALPDSPHHRRHPRHSLRNRLPRPARFDPHALRGSHRCLRAHHGSVFWCRTAAARPGLPVYPRHLRHPHPPPRLPRGACMGERAGLWVAIRIQLAGHVNTLGWSTVAIYALLAIGFGMFALGKGQGEAKTIAN